MYFRYNSEILQILMLYFQKIDLKGTDKLRHFEDTIVVASVDELIARMKKRLFA